MQARLCLLCPGLLALGACTTSSPAPEAERARRQEEWARQVAASKAGALTVVSAGAEPRRVLAAPLAPGEELDAEVTVTSAVSVVGGDGEVKREDRLRARLVLSALPSEGGEPRIALTVAALDGDLPGLEQLPRAGTIEPGAYGEPWLLLLVAAGPDVDRARARLWESDVHGWARRILVPVPAEALGVGAVWRREWADYPGGEKVVEIVEYQLRSLGADVAEIHATATTAGASGAGEAEGRISLPLGRRAVPTAEWRTRGSAALPARSGPTLLDARATTRISPTRASPR